MTCSVPSVTIPKADGGCRLPCAKKKNQLTLHSGAQILLFRTWGAKQHEEGGSESFQRRVRGILISSLESSDGIQMSNGITGSVRNR